MKKSFHIGEIGKIAKEILSIILDTRYSMPDKATLVALSGDLGAGKTTLTQVIAKEFGIKETIISPTFVIMKHYPLSLSTSHFRLLTHIDAYRLDSDDELLKLGWKELISDSTNLILIEWPERVKNLIPKDALWISLSHKDEQTRHIDITK